MVFEPASDVVSGGGSGQKVYFPPFFRGADSAETTGL
jgi:hypothetical protein